MNRLAKQKEVLMATASDLMVRAWVAVETWRASLIEDEEGGQGMVEYALILALVAVVAIVVLMTLGGRVVNTFNNASNAMAKVG